MLALGADTQHHAAQPTFPDLTATTHPRIPTAWDELVGSRV
jgi:hypothetical protein